MNTFWDHWWSGLFGSYAIWIKEPYVNLVTRVLTEVVKVKWDRAIRNSLVSEEVFWLVMSFDHEEHSHTVFRTNDLYFGGSNSRNNHWQSLVENPPTSTTCWKYRWRLNYYLKNNVLRPTEITILLFKDCFANAIYVWLKELGNISPICETIGSKSRTN